MVSCVLRRTSCWLLFSFFLSKAGTSPDCKCTQHKRQKRRKKRLAPSTAASDHSKDCSGGAANIINRRTVSAPYCSIMYCGSTPLFLDFDIFSMPPTVTGGPSLFK